MWITFKFSELWFIFCHRQPKSIKNTFQATKFKVEENSRNFQGLAEKFQDFSKKNGIQGLFKDFPQLGTSTQAHLLVMSLMVFKSLLGC